MNKFVRGIIATIAGLFLVAAFVTVIVCIMESITIGSVWPLMWLMFAAACACAGAVIMKAIDKKCDELKEDE